MDGLANTTPKLLKVVTNYARVKSGTIISETDHQKRCAEAWAEVEELLAADYSYYDGRFR